MNSSPPDSAIENKILVDETGFFSLLLDALENQIAVIDASGTILYVNQSWRTFGYENGASPENLWLGMNYLRVCGDGEDERGLPICDAANGIMQVISGNSESFSTEYPCDSPQKRRWFMMKINPLKTFSGRYFLISHMDITDRKLAEDDVQRLSMSDPLTGLANRRHFDDFLNQEWHRAKRSKKPLSLLMIDIDYFKGYNDTFGHIQGDVCLCMVSDIIKNHARRPTDLAARFGGEEFVLVLAETPIKEAVELANKLLEATNRMNIPGQNNQNVTISIGISNVDPSNETDISALISRADQALYQAKKNGRNRIEIMDEFAAEFRIPR